MKRLIAIILILALLLPAAALAADVPAWLIDGAWTHLEDNGEGSCSLISVYLTEDGKAYYVAQVFGSEEPSFGRAFVGSWTFTGPDTINVIIGNNATMDLVYKSFNMMVNFKTLDYYFRAQMRDGDTF